MFRIADWRVVRRLLLITAMLALPVAGYAQEGTRGGTVVDSTGGVLPGAAITAVHEASGNTFEGVTDERGAFRIGARAGVYRLTVVMPGFGTVNRQGVELLPICSAGPHAAKQQRHVGQE